jgi:HTH-type transcriptional regulator, sugar sensing transcriptional regulator
MKKPPERPEQLIECLKSLGMTKYEALVYIALLRVMSATASEIHESSGVPRASVYPVLGQLQDKDLVSVSQSTPKRFAAIPPQEAIDKLTARIGQDAKQALEFLKVIHEQKMASEEGSGELIWNIYGVAGIRKRLEELITGAETDIHIIAQPQILSAEVKSAIKRSAERVSIEIVTPQWDGPVPKNMRLFLKKHPGLPRELDRAKDMIAGGICIVDSRRVMVIVGSGEEDAVALFSESEGFVRFFVRYYSLIIDWAKKSD